MRTWLTLSLVAVLFFLLASGCSRGLAEEPIEIIYSGNLIGTIGPCNCPANKAGGLPRRAYTMNKLNSAITHRLVVDAGNFSAIHPDYGPQKTYLLLAAMGQLGVDAIHIGYRDLRFGLEFLEDVRKHHQIPFVAANVYDMETDRRAFPGHRMVRLGASIFDPGYLVAVIGITDQKRRRFPGKHFVIEDPRETLRKELDEIGEHASLIVLLTDAERADIINWTRDLSGRIDLVVSSNNRLGHRNLMLDTGIPLATVGRQGKYFDRLEAKHITDGHWEFERHSIMLDGDVPSEPKLVKFIRDLQQELKLTNSQVGDL